MKPIVKWAGGKTQLLKYILPIIPEFKTYYEPFFGGGALYFALEPKKAVINDSNTQLINLYSQIKNDPNKLIKKLTSLSNNHSEKKYYEIRKQFNNCLSNNELNLNSSAYFLYLNKMGFNGLYRLNKNGQYNVPSAHRKTCKLYDNENLLAVSKQLNKSKLLSGDFEKACKDCKKDDFVFFDSPYYNTFDTYQAGGFSKEDHIRLSNLFKKLDKKGVKCLLTNSNENFIKSLYKDFNIKTIKVKRMINCDGKNRNGEEVIITNF